MDKMGYKSQEKFLNEICNYLKEFNPLTNQSINLTNHQLEHLNKKINTHKRLYKVLVLENIKLFN